MEDTFIAGIIGSWVEFGLYDVILPFIFVYTIIFMILEKTDILGGRKNIDSLVAFCFGFIATASLQTVTALHMFFSATGFIVVAGLSVMLLVSMFGLDSVMKKRDEWYLNIPRYGIIAIIFVGMLYILAIAFGLERTIIAFIPQVPSAVTQMIIFGAVFVVILKFIMSGGNSAGSSSSAEESGGKGSSDKNGGNQKQSESGNQRNNSSSKPTLVQEGDNSKSFEV